jgi:predicted glutamine amidotransferase
MANTHPFEQEERVFAHNGHLEGLDVLDEHLGDYRRLVRGDTDSERFFALVTKESALNGGDPGAGLAAAARWAAEELPLFALSSTACSRRPPTCAPCAIRTPTSC